MPDLIPRLEVRRLAPLGPLTLCLPGGRVLPGQASTMLKSTPKGLPVFVANFTVDGDQVAFDPLAEPVTRVPDDLALAARAYAALSPANRRRFRAMYADQLGEP